MTHENQTTPDTPAAAEPAYALQGLSQKQAFVIAEALELVARLGTGQLHYLMEFVRFGGVTTREGQPIDIETLRAGDELVSRLKGLLTGFPDSASKGIGGETVPRDAQIAWEMRKAIRHCLAWDLNPGVRPLGVDYDDPYLLKYSKEPKVELTRQGPRASALNGLPEGCFLGLRNGRWTVAQPGQGAWLVLAAASTPQTAIVRAKAKLREASASAPVPF